MKRTTPCVLTLLLAACGPKLPGSGGAGTDGTASGGETGQATATSGDSSSTTGMEEQVVYDAHCGTSTNGFSGLSIRKKHIGDGFCTKLVFVTPGGNNSGEVGIDYPPMSEWELYPPIIIPDGSCIPESPEDTVVALGASGTVWWDDELRFMDVDVTLTLPPDPRWPDTDVLFAEGVPIEIDNECPPFGTGGSSGSGGSGGSGG